MARAMYRGGVRASSGGEKRTLDFGLWERPLMNEAAQREAGERSALSLVVLCLFFTRGRAEECGADEECDPRDQETRRERVHHSESRRERLARAGSGPHRLDRGSRADDRRECAEACEERRECAAQRRRAPTPEENRDEYGRAGDDERGAVETLEHLTDQLCRELPPRMLARKRCHGCREDNLRGDGGEEELRARLRRTEKAKPAIEILHHGSHPIRTLRRARAAAAVPKVQSPRPQVQPPRAIFPRMHGDMDIVDPLIAEFLTQLAPSPDPVEAEMRRHADELEGYPIAGPLVGALLTQLTLMQGARRVFEVGSGFGYSAFWLARGLGAGGTVSLSEVDRDQLERAHDYLARAGFSNRCLFEPAGDGLVALERCEPGLDLIFLDYAKSDYPRALAVALPKLRHGGILVANDVLWGGSVARGEQDKESVGLREFLRVIHGSEGLVSTVLPLGGGVSITWKR